MNLDPAVGVFLDGLIAVLLLATIATGIFLNRRIERLRRSTKDMNHLAGSFDKATARARAGVENLRTALRDSGAQLQEQIETARSLRDDLRQMAIAGGRLTLPESNPPQAARAAAKPAKKTFPNVEPKGMPRAEPPWAEPAQVMPLTNRVPEGAPRTAAAKPAVRKEASREVGRREAAAMPAQRAVANGTTGGQHLAAGGGLPSRKAAAAIAAAATEDASEVERELRELLRHVR
jgi:hypothetical protein